MRRPFDFINNEKIDLSKQSHRDEVVKRNKTLQNVIENGIDLYKIPVRIITRITIQCHVCGSEAEGELSRDYETYYDPEDNIPSLKCDCCKSTYNYHNNSEAFFLNVYKDESKHKP